MYCFLAGFASLESNLAGKYNSKNSMPYPRRARPSARASKDISHAR